MSKLKTLLKLMRFALIVLAVFMISGSPKALASFDAPTIYEQLNWYWYRTGGTLAACASTDSGGVPVGSDNRGIAFGYFVGQGFNNIQAAGIVGNLDEESGVDPYTNQNGGPAKGIAQWEAPRWGLLLKVASEQGKDPYDLMFQLSFISYELSHGYETVTAHVKSATTIEDAVNQWMGPNNLNGQPVPVTDPSRRSGGYENPGTPRGDVRLADAIKALKDFGGGVAGIGGGICVTVNCTDSALSSLSAVRQSVVCTARAELAKWQTSSPPSFTTYTDGNNEEWCADFVSWIYMTAGHSFTGGESGGWRWPGVYNLANVMPGQNSGFTNHTEKTYAPKPGDIAIHGSDHTNLVVAVSGNSMTTIGGNQGGEHDNSQSQVSQRTESVWASYVTSYVSPD